MPKIATTLTDARVANLRPKKGQKGWIEVGDSTKGLRLRVGPDGQKLWSLQYQVADKRVRKTLGAYPELSLAGARERAKELHAAGREGVSAKTVDARQKAEKMTMDTAWPEYMEAMKGTLRPVAYAFKQRTYDDHIKDVIGNRLLRSIRRGDVMEVFESVRQKGHGVTANRAFSQVVAFLRWAENKEYIDGVPTFRKIKVKEIARSRTLTDAELRAFWQATGQIGPMSRDFLRLLLLTGQRRDEVRLMTWEEVNLDEATWIIPGSRYKTGIDHAVPLTDAVLMILGNRWRPGATGYVLAGIKAGQPFNGAGPAMRDLRAKLAEVETFRIHDLRRTVRTGLSRLGVDEATAELVLGHIPQGIKRVYDRHNRMEERRKGLDRWTDFILSMTSDTASNIVPMVRRA